MRAFLLFPLLVASPALATCPTSDDLVEGVVLVQNEPFFQRADIEIEAEGYREVRLITHGENDRSVALFDYTHALAPTLLQTKNGQSAFAYDPEVATLDSLSTQGELRFEVSEVALGKPLTHQVIFTFEGLSERTIQSCTYQVWQVTELRAEATGKIVTRRIEYAPDLRLILALRDETRPEDDYVYTWIGTAADVER